MAACTTPGAEGDLVNAMLWPKPSLAFPVMGLALLAVSVHAEVWSPNVAGVNLCTLLLPPTNT